MNAFSKDSFTPAHRAKRTAFTLMEIIIVLAIMLILSAILFPAFQTARRKTVDVGTTSQLRQIGQALVQYIQDNEKYPPGRDFFDGHCFSSAWGISSNQVQAMPLTSKLLEPYASAGSIWRDPLTADFDDDDNGGNCSATAGVMATQPFTFVQRTELSLPQPVSFFNLASPENVDVVHTFGPWRNNRDLSRRWTVILFADGHVKGANRSELARLSQTPLAFN